MTDRVEIKSSEGAACLTLSEPEADRGGDPPGYFTATVVDANFRASSRVYAYGAGNIADLFEDLARNWRGWEGEKSGGSIEGDLCIDCESDRLGHTFARVTLTSGPYDRCWRAEVTIRLDAGQLDGLAKQARQFFGPSVRAV